VTPDDEETATNARALATASGLRFGVCLLLMLRANKRAEYCQFGISDADVDGLLDRVLPL